MYRYVIYSIKNKHLLFEKVNGFESKGRNPDSIKLRMKILRIVGYQDKIIEATESNTSKTFWVNHRAYFATLAGRLYVLNSKATV